MFEKNNNIVYLRVLLSFVSGAQSQSNGFHLREQRKDI